MTVLFGCNPVLWYIETWMSVYGLHSLWLGVRVRFVCNFYVRFYLHIFHPWQFRSHVILCCETWTSSDWLHSLELSVILNSISSYVITICNVEIPESIQCKMRILYTYFMLQVRLSWDFMFSAKICQLSQCISHNIISELLRFIKRFSLHPWQFR